MRAVGTSSTLNLSNTPMAAPAGARAPAHVDFDSRRLFNGTQEVRINHGGQEYRLRQTRNGKLILTK